MKKRLLHIWCAVFHFGSLMESYQGTYGDGTPCRIMYCSVCDHRYWYTPLNKEIISNEER